MKNIWLIFVAFMLSFPLSGGIFEVRKNGLDFSVFYRGQELVRSILSSNMEAPDENIRSSEVTMPNGSRVWNIWREDTACRIRQEIALAADGSSVEISMKGEAVPYSEKSSRMLHLSVPTQLLAGKKYAGLMQNGRSWNPAQGIFDLRSMPQGAVNNVRWRYFTVSDGKDFNVVFDVNPIGAGDYTSMYSAGAIKGVWDIELGKKELILRGGSHLNGIGGMTGAKIVLREGVMEEDYFKHHALKSYKERGPLAANYVLSFGAEKTGKDFTRVNDRKFAPGQAYGWLNNVDLQRNIDFPEGAYYSSMSGKNGIFRFSKLIPGVHIFTVSAGNFKGHDNKFSITVNGQSMVRDLTVRKGQLAVASLPVWINEKGLADIEFKGDFLVSAIGVQCLIAAAEDFSFKRGFWVSDGYESAILFRNQDYRPEAELTPALELIDMPVPGEETAGKLRSPALETALPAADSPGGMWRWTANCNNGYDL